MTSIFFIYSHLLLFLSTVEKRKGISGQEQEPSNEEAKFARVYEASKRRRKILIEEPEEGETEDVLIG